MGDFLYGNPAPPDSPAFSPSDRVQGCHAFGEDASKSFLEKNHLSHIICSSIVNEVKEKSIFIPILVPKYLPKRERFGCTRGRLLPSSAVPTIDTGKCPHN